jgi:hypothetical protein
MKSQQQGFDGDAYDRNYPQRLRKRSAEQARQGKCGPTGPSAFGTQPTLTGRMHVRFQMQNGHDAERLSRRLMTRLGHWAWPDIGPFFC